MSKVTIANVEAFVAALEEHRRYKHYNYGKDESASKLCAALRPLAGLVDVGEHPALVGAVASITTALELATERTGRRHLEKALVEAHVALADEIVNYAEPPVVDDEAATEAA